MGINRCVGCTRPFFTKSFLSENATVLPESSVDGVISTPIGTVREERARALPQHVVRRHLPDNERKFLDPALGLVLVEQPDRKRCPPKPSTARTSPSVSSAHSACFRVSSVASTFLDARKSLRLVPLPQVRKDL